MPVTTDLLKRFDLLRELTPDLLALLAQQSQLRKYARREIVIDPGQQEQHLYLLFEGSLQAVDFTLDGREVGLYFVRAGDLCGELGLFDAKPATEFVIALARSQVVLIPHSALEPIMYQSRCLIQALTQRLARRVHQLTEQRSLLALPVVSQRICRQLWYLTQLPCDSIVLRSLLKQQDLQSQPYTIELPPTQQEIAIMLNTTRETVTRVFQSLLAEEILLRNGNKTLIVNKPESLYQLAFPEAEST